MPGTVPANQRKTQHQANRRADGDRHIRCAPEPSRASQCPGQQAQQRQAVGNRRATQDCVVRKFDQHLVIEFVLRDGRCARSNPDATAPPPDVTTRP